MGLLDKVMFWKKEDHNDILGAPPTGLNQPTGLDLGPMGGQPGVPGQPSPPLGDPTGLGTPQPQAFQDMQQQQQPPPQNDLTSQKLEVISGKLDLIKAGIDNLNQRLERLEKLAEAGQKGKW